MAGPGTRAAARADAAYRRVLTGCRNRPGIDVEVTNGTLTVTALQRTSRTVPIVFVQVGDPVGGGIVESLARPGGNTTGFAEREYITSGKFLELLKEVAP